MMKLHSNLRCALLALALYGLATGFDVAPARAQALVATVNDDPITSYDIEQRLKLLKVLKRPALKDVALEAIIADRLRLRELKKYKLEPGTNERNGAIAKIAGEMKILPQALVSALQSSGIPEKDWSEFFKAEAGWTILTRGLNKGLEVSEREVRAEIEKRGGKAANSIEYLLRPIVFILPISATPDQWQARSREAEAFRTRFTDCTSGLQLARSLPEVAIKEQFSRAANGLPDDARQLFERTGVGHLTPASRGATGIEMLAICARRDMRDDASAGEDIRNELLAKKIDALAEKSYSEIRVRAVIVKR
jgi:peptidyl-prolyl cis-trans isomerase SurA